MVLSCKRLVAIKDYYRILNVAVNAPAAVIKNNYRKLALKYHPDRNADDELAAAVFSDVAEAYSVLSDQQKRKQYNFQRYLLAPPDYSQQIVSTEELLLKSDVLLKKVQSSDPFRINRDALLYALQQLTPLQQAAPSAALHRHLQNMLECAVYLTSTHAVKLQSYIDSFLQNDKLLQQQADSVVKQLRSLERWNTYKVILVIIATVVLCILIFKLSR